MHTKEFFSESPLEPFVYEPLDHATDSIRLIDLYLDPPDATIRCTIRHARLSGAKYTCLSYTWQPSHPQHDIQANGHPLSIGENLHQFLHAYRQSQAIVRSDNYTVKHESSLWIDAISIQQSKAEEKNHQVQQMGQIYWNAARMIIWLGLLDTTMQQFFADVNDIMEGGPT